MAGVLTGFLAGLALDVAPPGSHFVGQNALVFCLVGYACGLLADDTGDAEQGHTALFEIVVTAAGAVLGEALLALLGVMLSDPRVTWPAITNVLPAAVAYDVLLCPFVLYAVAAALRLGGRARRGEAARPVAQPGQDAGAGRGARARSGSCAGGSAPRLRLSERDKGRARSAACAAREAYGPRPGASPSSSWAGRDSGPRQAWARRSPRPGSARARPGSSSAAAAPARACSAARCPAARSRAQQAGGGPVPGSAGRLPGSAARAWAGPCSAAPSSAAGLPAGRRPFGRPAPLGLSSPLAAPGQTRRAAGWPGRAAVLPWPLARPALQLAAAPVGRAEVPGPGLAARRVLAPRLAGPKYAGRRVDAAPRLRRPPDRPPAPARLARWPWRPRLHRARPERPRRDFGHARLRMPRPKPRRRWRTGGYR